MFYIFMEKRYGKKVANDLAISDLNPRFPVWLELMVNTRTLWTWVAEALIVSAIFHCAALYWLGLETPKTVFSLLDVIVYWCWMGINVIYYRHLVRMMLVRE